jgi:hypothetical protein
MHSYRKFLSCAVLAGAALVPATRRVPAPRIGMAASAAPKVQSASGRITAVQANTFTLRIAQSGSDQTGVLIVTIDQDTNVKGQIEVGADASVTYRQEDGNNIAVSVSVVQHPS